MVKLRLKKNESFNIREGWLHKGLAGIQDTPTLFSQHDAMERLGMGSKMVKSLRHWMQASGLTQENNHGQRMQRLTAFGNMVARYDEYIEDIFTLWIIHYNIIKNVDTCFVWHYLFNDYKGADFTREDVQEKIKEYLDVLGITDYAVKSLKDECNLAIRMYLSDEKTDYDPEDNLSCPLSELGLIRKSARDKRAYNKTSPPKDKLDRLAVLYVMLNEMDADDESVSIDQLLKGRNNAGNVFNLNRVLLNEYLDELRVCGYITINRTAGLDMVYFNERPEPITIIEQYYQG